MLKIYGSSDDLIEVEGDIVEEYADIYFYEQVTYLVLSNEMIVSVFMETMVGDWRANVVMNPRNVETEIVKTGGGDEGILIKDDIIWIGLLREGTFRKRRR